MADFVERKQLLPQIDGAHQISYVTPVKCPYCGAFIEPVMDQCQSVPFGQIRLFVMVYHGNCCSKSFFTTYQLEKDSTSKLLSIYPPIHPTFLPETITGLSPRFVDLYNQAFTAEQQNHFELAGSGYRNAMEILIKDYAVNELSENVENVYKLSLNDAIGKYLTNIDLSNCADVIRLIGNDYTHYERKYDDVEFATLKRYVEIFITQIDAMLLMRHPIVPINRHHI